MKFLSNICFTILVVEEVEKAENFLNSTASSKDGNLSNNSKDASEIKERYLKYNSVFVLVEIMIVSYNFCTFVL